VTEMHGSIPVFSFVLSPAPRDMHIVVARRLTEKLQKAGWKWYQDFKYDEETADGILFEVYKEELVPIIKEFIVEYNV